MARVLVTGMSGAGKSTLLAALSARGHMTVDTDHDGWTLPDGLWDATRMNRLLADQSSVVVSGTVENQGQFYDRFDQVLLLTAPVDVLISRVRTRTNNPYGQQDEHLAEIRHYCTTVEPLLRSHATMELDGTLPIADLTDLVEGLLLTNGDPTILDRSGHADERQLNSNE